LTTYEALIEEYPYGFYAQYLEGSLLNAIGKSQEALDHYAISVRSNPRYAKSRLDLGLLEVNAGKFDAALAMLDSALQLAQADRLLDVEQTAHYGLAAAYANRGNREEALAELSKALRLNPRYGDALKLRESILSKVGN
jgi:tetratricopeptide (TPR) repeat protein